MRITFVLPAAATLPVGGFKVVYEYANALTGRGHQVSVVHAAFVGGASFGCVALIRQLFLIYPVKALLGSWRPRSWFALDWRVRLRWVPFLSSRFVPDADAVVATWWRTAEIVSKWPPRKGSKYYLLQHLETWGGPEQRVLATWRLPLKKIVIARWLQAVARELGESCHYVPNGLRFDAFGIDASVSERAGSRIAMMYHGHDWKGAGDGIAALHMAKAQLPQLRAELFGTAKKPAGLPEWIEYRHNPSQPELRAIYNRAAIFIAPSWSEGWGLPACEALMCGCALACTDIGGHREFAINDVTAVLSPPRDPAGLAANIVRLASDVPLRLRLSATGGRFIQQFTWQRAADRFEAALLGRAEPSVGGPDAWGGEMGLPNA